MRSWRPPGPHTVGKAEYARRYNEEVLSKLDALGKDAILLCGEMPGTFCHRRLVARWLEEELGISVPERGSDDGTQTTLYRSTGTDLPLSRENSETARVPKTSKEIRS